MDAVLSLTLPFFAVVGLGFLAGRLGVMQPGGISALNTFVFNFAMPALVINALATQPLSVLLDVRFLIAWSLAGVAIFALGAGAARFAGMAKLGGAAICGQAASVGNVGFLALPLVVAAFGSFGAGLAAAALIVDLVVLVPLSIALLEVERGGRLSIVAARRVAVGVIVNPFLISIAAGVAVAASGLTFAEPLQRFVDFLAGAAGPTALFALGVTLAGRHVRGDLAGIGLMSVLKLVLHPLAVFAALTVFGLPAEKIAIGTVIAAMPIAGNVFVIAEQYGVGQRRSSAAILVSTAAAVATVAGAVAWAKGIAG